MSDADKICEGGLEHLDLSAQDVEPTFENPGEGGVYRTPLREVACTRIGLGDRGGEICRRHEIVYR